MCITRRQHGTALIREPLASSVRSEEKERFRSVLVVTNKLVHEWRCKVSGKRSKLAAELAVYMVFLGHT